jgi:hypothetical protein
VSYPHIKVLVADGPMRGWKVTVPRDFYVQTGDGSERVVRHTWNADAEMFVVNADGAQPVEKVMSDGGTK